MGKTVAELCENFRKGLVSRRDFVQRLVVVTGGVVAARSPGLGAVAGFPGAALLASLSSTVAEAQIQIPLGGKH